MMSFESDLSKQASAISQDYIKRVAQELQGDLISSARRHKRSGDLARGIFLTPSTKKKGDWVVEGAPRSAYRDGTYHPMFFFTSSDGEQAITKALQKARKMIK